MAISCQNNKNLPIIVYSMLIRDCDGLYQNNCCIENVQAVIDNTDQVNKKTPTGCTIKRVANLTSTVTFDAFDINNDLMELLLKGAVTRTDVAGALTTGAKQTLAGSTYNISSTDITSVVLREDGTNYDAINFDNTQPTVTSVVYDPTGANTPLGAGTDYTISVEEYSLGDIGVSAYRAYINFLPGATNIPDNTKDIVITMDYQRVATGETKTSFNIATGAYSIEPLEITIVGAIKGTNEIISEFNAQIIPSLSGTTILKGGVGGDETADAETISLEFTVETDTDISWLRSYSTPSC